MSDPIDLPVLLVVEDDEGLQRQLKWAYDGYRVVVAGDRASAIEALRVGVKLAVSRGVTAVHD